VANKPQLTEAEIEQLAQMTCPNCRAGIPTRYRTDTREYVHDQIAGRTGVQNGHTICWASGMRDAYRVDGN
jgi:hypothetical protein